MSAVVPHYLLPAIVVAIVSCGAGREPMIIDKDGGPAPSADVATDHPDAPAAEPAPEQRQDTPALPDMPPDVPDAAGLPDVPDVPPDFPPPPDLPPESPPAPDLPDSAPELPPPDVDSQAEPAEVLPDAPVETWPDLPAVLPPDVPGEPAEDVAQEAIEENPEEVEPEVVEPKCWTWGEPPPPPPPGPMLEAADFKKLGKAKPDEKFVNKNGKEVDKVNQAYVWSLAKQGGRVYVGTVANTMCLVFTPFAGSMLAYQSPNAVCEVMGQGNNLFADWRPPEIWQYDTSTKGWTQRKETLGTDEDPGIAHETMGWRASIAVGPYYLVAGPGTGLLWGMPGYGTSLAIYKDGQYMGSHKETENNDARKWLDYGGRVYYGTQSWDGSGLIRRWDGDESNLPESLFQFTEVGHIPGMAAWLTGYKQRIYAITWPTSFVGGGSGFELWRSPKIPPCGLTEEHFEQWEKVFAYSDYDPDPATNKMAGGGAMEVFQGALYFGSMHVPFTATCHNPQNMVACALEKYLCSDAFSLFRLVEYPSGAMKVDCLFGKDSDGPFKPLAGKQGFGNHYNNYLWSLTVHDGWLYAGTMDYSFFMADSLVAYGFPAQFPGLVPYQKHGFDVWATNNGDKWVPVVTDGLGNPSNWGARQLLSAPGENGQRLWLGTANPFNLSAQGGWELWATGP